MKKKYRLLKWFLWYKKWLEIEYDTINEEVLTDLVSDKKLHCELPNNVINNKSWFELIN